MSEEPIQDNEGWGPLVSPRGMSKWWLGGIVCILFVLAFGIGWPAFMTHRGPQSGDGYRRAKSIMQALERFKMEYGSYPNDSTIPEVLKRHPEAKGLLGKRFSNDYFRQLIVSGYVDEQDVFLIGSKNSGQRGKDQAVEQLVGSGKCSFSYVVWAADDEVPKSAPILIAPLIPGKLLVDVDFALENLKSRRVIVGYSDGSAEYLKVRPDGKIFAGGGLFFFDSGQATRWEGKEPRIAWPE